MYRSETKPEAAEAPPKEFDFVALNREAGRRSGYLALQLFALPIVVAVLISIYTTPLGGLVAMIVSAGLCVAWWRRKREERVFFRVEGRELLLCTERSSPPKVRIHLDELLNVSLDTKSIERVQEGGSAIPAMRFIDAQVGPAVDKARIVLVRSEGPLLPLTREYLAYMDATELLGKVRVFLRKHGWVPDDERDHPPSSSLDDDGPESEVASET